MTATPTSTIRVLDQGHPIAFSFEDMLRYHGPGSPGGVAHAFKIMELAFAVLDPEGPPERREITVTTAFGGPGARDGFEAVTRAVTEDRYVVDPGLTQAERGTMVDRFVFRLGYRGRSVTLAVRDGVLRDDFVALVQKDSRGPEEEARLTHLKQEMADRVMATPAAEVYDVTERPGGLTEPQDACWPHSCTRVQVGP